MATAIITESDTVDQKLQALFAKPVQAQVVTYTTNARTLLPLKDGTLSITIGTDGTKAYIAFGDANVSAGATTGTFDAWQAANTLVTYLRGSKNITHVALYDGQS
jgi:hypothetical protein